MEPSNDFKQQQVNPELVPHPFEIQNQSRWQSALEFYRANKWYVWALVVGIIIIGVLAFFALRPQTQSPTAEANVEMTIDAPETAAAGSEMVYKVKLQNNDKASLENLELEMVYPDGGSYVSSTPKANNISGTRFDVPDLSSGQNAALIIKVKVEGSINDEKKLTAILHYNYSNFSSEFQKQQTHTVRLTASDVAIEMSGPQESTNAQQVTYTVNYSNNSDSDIANARVQVTYPEGFSFADGSPKPDLAKNIWNVGLLRRGGNGTLTFQGTFKSAQPGQSQRFIAEFQVQDAQGSFYTQATGDYATSISALPLVVTQSLDDRNSNGVVKPGDTLNYIVKYSNTAAVAASGVNVVLALDSKALDLSTIRAEGGDVNNNTITWNASGVSNLERLNPNESGTLRFSIAVRNPAVRDSAKNIAIKTTVKVKSNEYSTFLPGNDLELKVSSPSQLSADVAFVSGQLPLRVGQGSMFEIKLTLKNSSNDYSDGVLTGFVPSGSVYQPGSVNSKEASNVSFDTATGKVTWKVGTLAAHSGSFAPLRTLTFNVRISPASSQIQQPVTLFRTIAFSAKDTFTGQDSKLDTDDAKTTDIPNGFSDGRVQP